MEHRRCSVGVFAALWAVATCAACPPAPGDDCEVTTDCGAGRVCVDGTCIADPDPLPVGEGEGEKGEGEGETGEGEGEAGEGEGEGEGEPVCTPACGEFQECNAGTCEFIGDVCDAFADNVGISGFSDRTFNLDGTDKIYPVQGELDQAPIARPIDNLFYTDMAAGTRMQVDVSGTGLDPMMFIVDTDNGTCNVRLSDDDTNGQSAHLEFNLRASDNLLVSAFSATSSGSFTVRSRPLLCGNEPDSLATFIACDREDQRLIDLGIDPCTRNPCVHDDNGNITGKFCCQRDSCLTGFANTTIELVTDTAVCN